MKESEIKYKIIALLKKENCKPSLIYDLFPDISDGEARKIILEILHEMRTVDGTIQMTPLGRYNYYQLVNKG